MLQSALSILSLCESRSGAALRAKFALAATLMTAGDTVEGERLKEEVMILLRNLKLNERKGWDGHMESLSEQFFDEFVLFCHR